MRTILDISAHQNGIKLNSLTGVDSYIYRASIGTSKWDANLKDYMSQNGLPTGLYVASYAKNASEAVAEAEYVCDIAKQYGIKPVMFFDWEYFSANYIKKTFGIDATPELVRCMTKAFCDKCIELGYKTGVYFNLDYLNRFYGREFFAENKNYIRWYARPGKASPDFECDLWQYASNAGTEFGYAGNVDKNLEINSVDGAVYVEPMKPLSAEPARLIIGFASAGDLAKIETKLNGLGISTTTKDGFIVTDVPVSSGDQCYIMIDCNALGIECEIYNEPAPAEPTPEEKIEEIVSKLDEEIEKPVTEEIPAVEESGNWLVKLLKFIISLLKGE